MPAPVLPRLAPTRLALIWMTIMVAVAAHAQSTSIYPVQLKTDSLVEPFGLDSTAPRFSWQLAAASPAARNLGQTAYRILVAASYDGTAIWDSGRVQSSRQIDIACACRTLAPHTLYSWKVMTWDQNGRPSPWSASAHWLSGMLSPATWQALWIAAAPVQPTPAPTREGVDLPLAAAQPLPLFRRDFTLAKPVAGATVAVSGLGQYDLHVNGKHVTATVMNPGWTDYRKRIFYNMYDVTSLLQPGANTLGVLLGNGMYDVPNVAGRYNKFTGSFGQPKMILQLMIRFADGSAATIVSDKSWTSAPGPITFSSIYGGEDYDARRDQSGWDQPGFNAPGWTKAAEVPGPGGTLIAQQLPPVVVAHTYTPIGVRHFVDGSAVYDLGKNFSGWPNLVVQGSAGSRVKLLPGELLDPSGHVTQASNNAHPGFDNSFSYTLKGGGKETWRPQFSYNGFRYVEANIEAQPTSPGQPAPDILALTGSFLHDGVPVDGAFQTSNQLFTQIHQLIDQAILSNMVSVLTDCPTREKLGWLEQTHLAATSIMYNYGVLPLYRKMANDMADAQLADGLIPSIAPEFVAFIDSQGNSTPFRDSPEWGSAIILSPMAAFRFYGDTAILADHYQSMQRYIEYLASKSKNNLLDYGLGDWYDIGPGDPGESKLTGKGLTATAIYYQDLLSMAEIANILARPQDAAQYTIAAAEIKSAFNRAFFHPDTAQYDRGSQTADAMPLALGLVPEESRQRVLDNLVNEIRNHDNHITAGDIGFHYVVRALSDNGRSDVLAAMLLKTDPPSYGYQIKQGATSLTEAWNANPASSQNHFMLGHAEEWFYRGLAGIEIDLGSPESRRIRIHPSVIDEVDSAAATVDTVFGPVTSGWKRLRGGVQFDIAIPPGQQATVLLPGSHLTENARPVEPPAMRRTGGTIEFTLGSGIYHFFAN